MGVSELDWDGGWRDGKDEARGEDGRKPACRGCCWIEEEEEEGRTPLDDFDIGGGSWKGGSSLRILGFILRGEGELTRMK